MSVRSPAIMKQDGEHFRGWITRPSLLMRNPCSFRGETIVWKTKLSEK
jgi:hypothetical protein